MDPIFEGNFIERQEAVMELLNVEENFDIIHRVVEIGGRRACLFTIDGFLKGDLIEKLMEFFYSVEEKDMPGNSYEFLKEFTPYADLTVARDRDKFITYILAGMTCVLIDGYKDYIALDLRTYPSRSVEEPDKDKVLRGSRDGFVESVVPNVTLIRRRIRDIQLVFELTNIGKSSKTDVVFGYMKDRVKPEVLKIVKDRLKNIKVDSLTMNQESLVEELYPGHWWNPFPKFKYSERPDTAAACLLEGSIVILVDNSPSVIIVPTSLFDIIEDVNDYYFPPITGTYLRLSRMIINLLAIFLTPLFMLFIKNPEWVPGWLEFIKMKDTVYVLPIIQFLILEFAIDGLKMASVNTPGMLTTPLSIIAGIVFGDYTVKSGWFNSEIMLYMAFVAVANYSQSNMELGYAIKFHRIILLVLTGFFGIYGFVGGTAILVLALCGNKTLAGRGYLYPLIPFDKIQLFQRFFRISLPKYTEIHKNDRRSNGSN